MKDPVRLKVGERIVVYTDGLKDQRILLGSRGTVVRVDEQNDTAHIEGDDGQKYGVYSCNSSIARRLNIGELLSD